MLNNISTGAGAVCRTTRLLQAFFGSVERVSGAMQAQRSPVTPYLSSPKIRQDTTNLTPPARIVQAPDLSTAMTCVS